MKSATAVGGSTVSYRPGGRSTVRSRPLQPAGQRGGQLRRRRRRGSRRSTARDQADRCRSADFALTSSSPVGCTQRSRTPVDEPRWVVVSLVPGEAVEDPVAGPGVVERRGQRREQVAEDLERRRRPAARRSHCRLARRPAVRARPAAGHPGPARTAPQPSPPGAPPPPPRPPTRPNPPHAADAADRAGGAVDDCDDEPGQRPGDPVGGHRVVRPPDVRLGAGLDDDDAAVGRGRGERGVDDLLRAQDSRRASPCHAAHPPGRC